MCFCLVQLELLLPNPKRESFATHTLVVDDANVTLTMKSAARRSDGGVVRHASRDNVAPSACVLALADTRRVSSAADALAFESSSWPATVPTLVLTREARWPHTARTDTLRPLLDAARIWAPPHDVTPAGQRSPVTTTLLTELVRHLRATEANGRVYLPRSTFVKQIFQF